MNRAGGGGGHLVFTMSSLRHLPDPVSGDRNVTRVYLLFGIPNLDQRE